MKTPLALLALSASTALFADNCCDPCCKPCCIPQPRAPICCECYTPAFYDMQCNWGVFVTLDFLYFYSRESNLPYANLARTVYRAAVSKPLNATVPVSYKYLDTKWKPGVRVGLGWNSDCDGWDLYANWTWYKGEGRGSTSVTPFSSAVPPGGAQGVQPIWSENAIFYSTGLTSNYAFFNSVSAKWGFTYNQIDLELGRRYYLSECFTMRPYTGLRGNWSRTHFNVRGSNSINVVAPTPALPAPLVQLTPAGFYILNTKDKFNNHNWGVGFLAGVQPTFYFTEEFSLWANADLALLWGKFRNSTKRNYTSTQNGTTQDILFTASPSGDFAGMQPMFDLSLGLRWETYWCEKRYGLELDIGWEHHLLFSHNTREKSLNGLSDMLPLDGSAPASVAVSSASISNNVALGGFLLRAKFSF